MQDELRPEYDLRHLQVRKMGPERKHFGRLVVKLERFLIRVTKKNKDELPDPSDKA